MQISQIISFTDNGTTLVLRLANASSSTAADEPILVEIRDADDRLRLLDYLEADWNISVEGDHISEGLGGALTGQRLLGGYDVENDLAEGAPLLPANDIWPGVLCDRDDGYGREPLRYRPLRRRSLPCDASSG